MARRMLCGFHAVQTALDHTPGSVVCLWLETGRQDRRSAQLQRTAQAAGIRIQSADRKQIERLSQGGHHQGVVAEVDLPVERGEPELAAAFATDPPPQLLLVLDHVQDPHNLGACLRSCDAAGADGLVITRDQSAHLTPTVCKIASGAAETVPVYAVTNLARSLRWLKEQGMWVVGAAGEAEQNLHAADLDRRLALVLGAEGSGLRRLTRETCDYLVRIPMCGQVQSLNVSVAAGVLLYEVLRQRARHG